MSGGYYDDISLPLHTAEIEGTDNSRFAPPRALHKDTAPYDPTKENRDDFSPSVGMPDRSVFCSLRKGVSPRDFQLPPNAYITVKNNKGRLIFLCKEHIYSLYLCLCRVLENPYSSTDEIGDMCIIMHLPDKPYLYKYNGGGRRYTIRFSSTDSAKSLTVSEKKLVDFAQKLADNVAFCEMFPKEKEELQSLCHTS
ncbi:MAG: hypothetical protein LUG95_05725 [Clostridiales bacterium]|nr:hypothetical protein [Clostridiales bacterium]